METPSDSLPPLSAGILAEVELINADKESGVICLGIELYLYHKK